LRVRVGHFGGRPFSAFIRLRTGKGNAGFSGSVKARVDIKKVPFHGTEEEWKRIQREREKDNTALLFIVIIGGIVGVGLLISRQ